MSSSRRCPWHPHERWEEWSATSSQWSHWAKLTSRKDKPPKRLGNHEWNQLHMGRTERMILPAPCACSVHVGWLALKTRCHGHRFTCFILCSSWIYCFLKEKNPPFLEGKYLLKDIVGAQHRKEKVSRMSYIKQMCPEAYFNNSSIIALLVAHLVQTIEMILMEITNSSRRWLPRI